MNNYNDDNEVPLRNLHSPKSDNRLPSDRHSDDNGRMSSRQPDENGNAKRRSTKRGIGRKRSHNVMEIRGLSSKRRSDIDDSRLPKETTKRIDYVIVYENKSIDEITDTKDKAKHEKNLRLRAKFLKSLKYDEVAVQEDVIGELVFMKLHVSFRRLCKEADRIKLEMPLQDVSKFLLLLTTLLP